MQESNKTEQQKSFSSVSKQELNSWKRGFTPQAEIWNGRMAMFGLFIGMTTLLMMNFLYG